MTKEQKEGVLIATVSMVALLILALLTNWTGGFSEATFDFFVEGSEAKCIPTVIGGFNLCTPVPRDKYGFSIKFQTILIFCIPIISYGILRAFGIVNRLFQFEEKLFKFIDE